MSADQDQIPTKNQKNKQISFQKQLFLLDSGGLFVDIVINSIMNYVLRLTKKLGLLKTIDLNLFIFFI